MKMIKHKLYETYTIQLGQVQEKVSISYTKKVKKIALYAYEYTVSTAGFNVMRLSVVFSMSH